MKRPRISVDREALRAAASSSEPRDAHDAREIWKGLADGTWTLVDCFDADGKRLFVARRTQPGVRDPRTLTLRESQVVAYASMGHRNKQIAYDLGLSVSTVGTHLSSAMKKLGVTRTQLVGGVYVSG